jgi:hypothetical protein
MPYVDQITRTKLDDAILTVDPESAGELNYTITQLCLAYLAQEGLSYSALNEVVGVLECAKLELYRRAAAPYEDEKASLNGDVYEGLS